MLFVVVQVSKKSFDGGLFCQYEYQRRNLAGGLMYEAFSDKRHSESSHLTEAGRRNVVFFTDEGTLYALFIDDHGDERF
jgi:hypothetical protein